LDALLTEVVGAGAYVDLSDSADFDEASQDGDELKATSDEGEASDAEPYGSEATDSGPEQEEPDEDEGDVPVRSASEEAAVQRPVPDAWLIAAESWHQARKGFDKVRSVCYLREILDGCLQGQNTVRRETGVACPCRDCQKRGGRFWAVDWRGYVNHFGSYVFRWRISCPFRGCVAAPRTRTQFLQHLKRVHREETGAG